MKFKLTDEAGRTLERLEITDGAPTMPPEIVRFPSCNGRLFVLAIRDDPDGCQVYRPAKGIVELPA